MASRAFESCVSIQPGSFTPPPSRANDSAMCFGGTESLSAKTSITGMGSFFTSADQS
jgi:hypothetical protein